MTTDWWNGGTGSWWTAATWSKSHVPGPSEFAIVVAGSVSVAAPPATSRPPKTIAALTIDSPASVSFQITGFQVTGNLTNQGTLAVKSGADGAAALTVEGALKNSGGFNLGRAGMTASAKIVVGALTNLAAGRITVAGGASVTATLQDGGNFVNHGRVTATLGAVLQIGGPLTNWGTFTLNGGARAALGTNKVPQNLTNSGKFYLDVASDGGSSLNVTGALVNNKTFTVGNASLSKADTVNADSLDNQVNGVLTLTGNGSIGPKLTVAASFANEGTISEHNGAAIVAQGGLTNTGIFNLDAVASDGGSSLNVTGALVNNKTFTVGNASLSKADTVNADSLDNQVNGVLTLTGNGSIGPKLTVAASFANEGTISEHNGAAIVAQGGLTNTGIFNLDAVASDGGSSLNVTGALVNNKTFTVGNASLSKADTVNADSLDNQVNGVLTLTGNGSIGPKLTVAASFANEGTISEHNGAAIVAQGGLTNTGIFNLDAVASDGGSSLNVTGALVNNKTFTVGNASLSKADTVNADSLDNQVNGVLTLTGNGSIDPKLTVAASFANEGTISEHNGAAIVAQGGLTNTGIFNLDAVASDGGSSLNVTGALVNNKTFTVGNASLSKADTVNADSLDNQVNGVLTLTGNGSIDPKLTVAASFANEGTISEHNGAAIVAQGGLTNTGIFNLDAVASDGGSSLNVTGALVNNKTFTVGNASLSKADTVNADSLDNQVNGVLTLTGNGSIGPKLTVAASFANEGTISEHNGAAIVAQGGLTNTGIFNLDAVASDGGSSLRVSGTLFNSGTLQVGNWQYGDQQGRMTAADGLSFGAIVNAAGGTLAFNGGATQQTGITVQIASAADFSGVAGAAELTGNVQIDGYADIIFASGSIQTASGSLDMIGPSAFIDDLGKEGQNSALVGLTSITGKMQIENGATVMTNVGLTVDGKLLVDEGYFGGSTLAIGGALSNTGTGTVTLGNGGMTAGDMVTATALTNAGTITLNGESSVGPTLAIGNGAPSANSGKIEVGNATLTFAGDFTNSNHGTVGIDDLPTAGGSIFAVGGALTNETGASMTIGDASTAQATTASAATVDNQSRAQLSLLGSGTFAPTFTVKGAAANAFSNEGTLSLFDGAAVDVSQGGFVNAIGAEVHIDDGVGAQADGGSSLSVAGELENDGAIVVGNRFLAVADTAAAPTIVASSLLNTGSLTLVSRARIALHVEISGAADFTGGARPGELDGNVSLTGDAAIEFGSGQITTIAGSLTETGANASIGDRGAGVNSALLGLALINAGGTLDLENGASVTTGGALTNAGALELGVGNRDGGSSLTIGGELVNSRTLSLGNARLTSATTLTVTALDNTGGSISVIGGYSATNTATLVVLGGADLSGGASPGTLVGALSLSGYAAVDFLGGGSIATIGGSLKLTGANAFLEDDNAQGSNSALSGLSSIAVGGVLDLEAGAQLSTSGALTVSGNLYLDTAVGAGGSELTIGGGSTLTNNGTITIGSVDVAQASTLNAAALTNNGTISIVGGADVGVTFSFAGAVDDASTGAIALKGAAADFAGAVTGGGRFTLNSGSQLEFDGSVGKLGDTIAADPKLQFGSGGSELVLGNPAAAENFNGTVYSFGAGDSIDLAGFGAGSSFNFSAGVLTVTNGSEVANFRFSGTYSNADFALTSSGSDSLISFV